MIILTEKPSVAKSFSDVFNCTEEHFVSGKIKLKYYVNKKKDKQILIATDADREGEIIARECLLIDRGICLSLKIIRAAHSFWTAPSF